jgi:heat shock protein HslJ
MKKLVILIILFAACRPSHQISEMVGAINQRSLEDTVWIAKELNGKTVTVAKGEKAPFFKLLVTEQQLHGFGGCNTLNGSYKKDGDKLSAQLASTRMFCEGKMDMEKDMLGVLNLTTRFSIEGDMLTLKHEGKVVAVFTAETETAN